MVWVGGGVLLGALGTRVLGDRDPGAVDHFIGNPRVIGPAVLAPATLTVVGLGVMDRARQQHLGIRAALGPARARALRGRLPDRHFAPEPGSWSWGYRLIVLLLIAATWDMANKPGL
jgi:hypothetical protein